MRETARQRVLARQCREVHAWCDGVIAELPRGLAAVPITYNPYRAGSFTTRDGMPLARCEYVHFTADREAVALGEITRGVKVMTTTDTATLVRMINRLLNSFELNMDDLEPETAALIDEAETLLGDARDYVEDGCSRPGGDTLAAKVDESARNAPLYASMIAHGFEPYHTGGGCMAWRRSHPRGGYWLITTGDGASLGEWSRRHDRVWMVGLYNGEGDEIALTRDLDLLGAVSQPVADRLSDDHRCKAPGCEQIHGHAGAHGPRP